MSLFILLLCAITSKHERGSDLTLDVVLHCLDDPLFLPIDEHGGWLARSRCVDGIIEVIKVVLEVQFEVVSEILEQLELIGQSIQGVLHERLELLSWPGDLREEGLHRVQDSGLPIYAAICVHQPIHVELSCGRAIGRIDYLVQVVAISSHRQVGS